MFKFFLHKTKKLLLDLFFPIKCLSCGKFDQWICDECHKSLPILTEQVCFLCKNQVTQNGEICPFCRQKNSSLDGVFVVSTYQNNLLKKSIHYFKYNFIESMAEPLTLLIAQSLQNSTFPAPDFIIPIPLHKKRLRWRGFNQAEILAKNLDLKIPILNNIVIKKTHTTPQAKMKTREQRINNLKGVFTLQNPEIIKNKKILLIDDVMTTGTTLEKSAEILKSFGAKEVRALVLARE